MNIMMINAINARVKAAARLAAEKNVNIAEIVDVNKIEVKVVAKKVSIRSVAEALLAKSENAMSYDAILAAVKSEFPAAKTTVGCLRWYAAQMREAGVVLPKRPRAVAAV